jgi:hypothetical protein
MNEALAGILAQIPSGAVIIVVVIFLKYLEKLQEKADKADERNKEFIQEQRRSNNESTEKLAENIGDLTKCFTMHDEFVRSNFGEIRQDIQDSGRYPKRPAAPKAK